MEKYICIHGHFYQPPRENPWLEEVELQDSAYPYHDWNERITAECYGPNTASRIFDPEVWIVDIVNNYSKISFNFGPTLLTYLERHKPQVYRAILEADHLSMERFSGHGSAIAQAYNHMIMPLANRRDKETQVIWGIKDFQKRFNRHPDGMWLPETAADTETLEVLAERGIKFTILAPRQAKRIRKMVRGARWQDMSEGTVDPSLAYLCPLPSGRSIHLFFYDGPISQEVAFSGLLNTGEGFANRLVSAFNDQRNWPQIVHIATDGETYGHHHRFADMALAYCLRHIESQHLATLTNYGEYLDRHPATYAAEIFDNSSWSCVHGVERWKENCGCNSGTHPGWHQAWRKPLRETLDGLRDRLTPIYEAEGSKYLKDVWEARNGYIEVLLNRSPESVERFMDQRSLRTLSGEEKVKVLKLLEMQKNAMFMFTSCGWFFDEISGIETTQVIQYASRAIQHTEELTGTPLEPDFLKALENAPSNIPDFQNGSKIYEMFVRPAKVDLLRVGAHFAISSLFEQYPEKTPVFSYTAFREDYDRTEAGKLKLAVGRSRIVSEITREEERFSFAVLHLGDHNLNGGVKTLEGEEAYSAMCGEIKDAFGRSDVTEIIRLMDKHFGTNNYSLSHLFKDEQRKILSQILSPTLEGIEVSFRDVYEKNYPLMNFLQSIHMPLPRPLLVAAEYIVNRDLKKIFEEENLNVQKLETLVQDSRKWPLDIDKATIGFAVESRMNSLMGRLEEEPEQVASLEEMVKTLKSIAPLALELDLWKIQNGFFSIEKKRLKSMTERAEKGDEGARRWTDLFRELASHLRIRTMTVA